MGLPVEVFWYLSPREYDAYCHVHEQSVSRWALFMAVFMNANYKRPRPFTMEEFLGKPPAQKPVQSIEEKRAVMARFKGSAVDRGQAQPDVEQVPEWALELGRKQGIK